MTLTDEERNRRLYGGDLFTGETSEEDEIMT
jgi:hypothetical protein